MEGQSARFDIYVTDDTESKKGGARFLSAPKLLKGGLVIAVLVIGRRWFQRYRARQKVADRLPLAKSLPTVGDRAGHYDLDGVSFDSEGVIVSGDAVKPVTPPMPVV